MRCMLTTIHGSRQREAGEPTGAEYSYRTVQLLGVHFWAQERWYRRRVLCSTVSIGAYLWLPDSIFPVE